MAAQAGHPLTPQQIGEINGCFNDDFDASVQAAIDGTFAIPGTHLDCLQCDVALVYGLRNYGAHNTGTAPRVYQRFGDVEQILFRVLFASLDFL